MPRPALALPAAVLALAGCRQPNVFQPPPPPAVTVQQPIRREVELSKEFVGRTEASETVEIRARVKGFLQSILFEPGDWVTAGDPLFVIEPESFEAAVDAAAAELARMTAARDLADATLKRAQGAYDKGAVSDIEMLERQAQLDAAEGAAKAAQAALIDAELDLSYTQISAPIDGRLSRDFVTIGNLVGSGDATLLTTVRKDNPIFAYFNVNERELLPYLGHGRERREHPARLQLSDGRDYDRQGVVDFADNTVDPVTGTIQVRASFPNPDGALAPGLFVRVLLPEEATEALLVPEIAIQRDLVGPYLLVVGPDDVVKRRDVVLGRRLDDLRIVESGLDGSERVIVQGLQRARADITVRPQEAAG